MQKSSLVIVYHRQPYEEVEENGKTVFRANKSPNGIVPTLKAFFKRLEPGRGAWVAWKEHEEGDPDFERVIHIDDENGGFHVRRLPLTKQQSSSFYHVTSKEAFWPVLHSFPWLFSYDNVDWRTFHEVNRLFAEAAAEQADDGALVWIHDYNLWLVPHYLRQIRPDVKIAFYHHTPFPSQDVFNVLPWRAEILGSLLDCDLVGFHIPRYAKNFTDVARGLTGAEISEVVTTPQHLNVPGQALSEPQMPRTLKLGDREIAIDISPVGADVHLIDDILAKQDTSDLEDRILGRLDGRKLIVTVGRTDYTKGTIEALKGFERLIDRRPDLRGKIKMLCVSVRAASGMAIYDETQRDIEQLVGRVNGLYSNLGWTPIVLYSNAIPFDRLMSYYKAADMCVTTPLRDGLNLVAKEFVAAKNGEAGKLILSEFAGCAVELPEAIYTNPYGHRDLDRALDEALAMDDTEAKGRMKRMRADVETYDIVHWIDSLFASFERVGFDGTKDKPKTVEAAV
ncbi:glucosylglycerol-phosphate synthase [Croceicoccus pelagius]|uniref:Glucosylglycerol-phosphate synthase n=1 Tax=Croceicoccus pelagius TaxID=1703341 RepID=A0A916YC06_9SPHN|nr:glucosylglycerol-phosphate synthase [Croceicoccus pelagius]GGD39562.1 hypothetical protein GCM10010989_12160 [Croceicoccus pelagius]